MRSLEGALCALAEYVGVPYNRDCWGRIIDDIEKKIHEPDKSPRTEEKLNRQRFCAKVALEFGYFKTAWRNYTMHAWEYYLEGDAAKIMEHVRDFMQLIATGLFEKPHSGEG